MKQYLIRTQMCLQISLNSSLRHTGLWNCHRQSNLFLTLSNKPGRRSLWSKCPTSFSQSAAFSHVVDQSHVETALLSLPQLPTHSSTAWEFRSCAVKVKFRSKPKRSNKVTLGVCFLYNQACEPILKRTRLEDFKTCGLKECYGKKTLQLLETCLRKITGIWGLTSLL